MNFMMISRGSFFWRKEKAEVGMVGIVPFSFDSPREDGDRGERNKDFVN